MTRGWLCVLSLLLWLTAGIGWADAWAVQLSFSLYAVGIPVAESYMKIDLAPSTYDMALRYRTTGLASVVAGGLLDQTSNGTVQRDQLMPLTYHSYVKLHGQDRVVALAFRNGDPLITQINPTNESEREI